MKNSMLFDSLRTLSKQEFREFGKFLNSPYFNNRSEVSRFYDSIKKYFPEFNADKIELGRVFSKIYPGKKYNDALIRKVISLTMQLFQKYITDIKIKQNRLQYDLELIEALKKRKLFNLHNKKFTEFLHYMDNLPETMEVYEYVYKSENELRLIYDGLDSQIKKSSNSLNKIYAYFFAVILNEQLNHTIEPNVYNVDNAIFEQIVSFLTDSEYRKMPLINYYFLMIKLRTTGENTYFHELVNFRNSNSAKLEKEHNYNALVVLIDQCLDNIGKGKPEFRKIMLGLSKMIFQEDLMNEISTEPITFTNIVRNSSYLKQFDWTEKFIDKNKENLHPAEKNSILNYCRGLIEFEKGNFAKSLKLLSYLNMKWFNMNNDIKKTILKCYYELGYIEELISQIDSYRHFIGSDNFAGNGMNTGNKKFIKYITRLNKLRININIGEAAILKSELEHSDFFYHKEWIILKLEQLLK